MKEYTCICNEQYVHTYVFTELFDKYICMYSLQHFFFSGIESGLSMARIHLNI